MAESEEIWEKIYDVSPKLGRTVRKLINIRCFEEDMNYFDGKLILKPTELLKFSGSLQERASLEDICKVFSINYKGALKDGKYRGYEGNYFYGKFFEKRKVFCEFEARMPQENEFDNRFILSKIKVRIRYENSPELLVGLAKSFKPSIDVHA